MKSGIYPLLTMCLFLTLSAIGQPKASGSKKPLIIFDTDMGPDYDDVGAISLLHRLAKNGECKILATVASDAHATIAPTIAVFNQHFGRPDIPVGHAAAGAPGYTANNHWNDSLIVRFPLKKKIAAYPSAVDVYRQVLAKQKDQSVTLVTVGFISNVNALLKSGPDNYSALSGMELVKRKVKNWVAMAGAFPQGKEFNVDQDTTASFEAFALWPGKILFSGFEIGQQIYTGGRVALGDISKNPVAWAYRYNLKTYDRTPQQNRPSWDQTAVLCAVRDPGRYFTVSGPGKFIADRQGANTWEAEDDGLHHYLSHKHPFEQIAKEIEDLMQ